MIRSVVYGPYELRPWYAGPGYLDLEARSLKSYRSREPRTVWQTLDEHPAKDTEISLYLCPKCLLYTSLEKDTANHEPFCRYRDTGPPGELIYDGPDVSVRKLDTDMGGDDLKLYMQSIALFGRLFLETKSLCFSLDGFWLYVAYDKATGLVAGFFSREKQSWHDYNLACIVVFPPFQHLGLGQLLIGLSYYLTRLEHTVGSPEKPLSEHGSRAYMTYWCREICIQLLKSAIGDNEAPRSLRDLALVTGIDAEDVATALDAMGALTSHSGNVNIDMEKVAACAENLKPPRGGFREQYVVNIGNTNNHR